MNKKRPVNLDIRTIQLPLTALTSILHRISGIMLFIFLGLILYMLSKSLESEKGWRRQKLSATPDLSGTVLPLCLIPNSALKSAPP
ncbi:succinate dehydrogenase, cytochrome b556 subunit, partial [Pseudomonas aeruginosa]|uniref:succinate dehydrogenase, cytochrome b556 subunit n=1 Tax=Pseudomonas aeruginosa TaxID=287 RepID=UPI001F037A49